MHRSSYFLTIFSSRTYPLLTFSCYMQNTSGKSQYTKPTGSATCPIQLPKLKAHKNRFGHPLGDARTGCIAGDMRASAAPYTFSDAPQLCLVVVVCIFLCVRRLVILIIVTMLGRVGGFTLLSATELTLKCAVIGFGAEVLHLPSLPCCLSLLTAAPHGVTPSFILSVTAARMARATDGSLVQSFLPSRVPCLTPYCLPDRHIFC